MGSPPPPSHQTEKTLVESTVRDKTNKHHLFGPSSTCVSFEGSNPRPPCGSPPPGHCAASCPGLSKGENRLPWEPPRRFLWLPGIDDLNLAGNLVNLARWKGLGLWSLWPMTKTCSWHVSSPREVGCVCPFSVFSITLPKHFLS